MSIIQESNHKPTKAVLIPHIADHLHYKRRIPASPTGLPIRQRAKTVLAVLVQLDSHPELAFFALLWRALSTVKIFVLDVESLLRRREHWGGGKI